MTKADIYQFIAKQKLGVLGTLSSGGSPQSALVGIAVTPELEIIFDTVKSSILTSVRACFSIVVLPAEARLLKLDMIQDLQTGGSMSRKSTRRSISGREVADHPGRHEERKRLREVSASWDCSESVLSLEG
jgi:hypothetical protein